MHLSVGQRLEQSTSEARETCRGHVLVPACVWRPGWAASEPRRPLQKETPSFRMVFLFGMLRAGPNSLPRPARSALNQEVRQGSCEWLRHSWDAGSESSLVTFFAFAVCGDADNKSRGQSQRNTIPIGWCFFAFAGPPAMCSPSCRQHKSVVFLRRFCFARKMEQRERYSIICCTFFCLQPLCRRLHRR